jgi:hypothetical protein
MMIFPIITILAILPFCLCDISIVAFDDDQCAGEHVGPNIHSNQGAVHESSGCQANGNYSSVKVLALDAGYQCNLYLDEQCQMFTATAKQTGCMPIDAKGIICFSQASFDDPLAGTQGILGIGASTIIAKVPDIASSVDQLVEKVCGTGVCDTTTKDIITFNHAIACETGLVNVDGSETLVVCDKHEKCTQTMTVDGHFSNTNQKEYMKEALKTAMKQGTGLTPVTDGSDDKLNIQLSFAGVQVNDAKGANLGLVCFTSSGHASVASTSLG